MYRTLLAATIVLLLIASSASCGEATAERPRLDVPFVPTPQVVVDKMLQVAGLKETDVLCDLGCGDGRIVVTAAKEYGCKAVGYDIDPARIAESLENAKEKEVEDLTTFELKSIFDVDLSEYTVVTMYLLPDVNLKLIPQLKKLKPGARIVSHAFDLDEIEPDETFKVEDGYTRTIYLWKAPLKDPKDDQNGDDEGAGGEDDQKEDNGGAVDEAEPDEDD